MSMSSCVAAHQQVQRASGYGYTTISSMRQVCDTPDSCRAAAKAALGSDQLSAALRAVSATAAHRLSRGIWTSPGAGDLNRYFNRHPNGLAANCCLVSSLAA
jgi:hypothetical protein